MDEAKDVPRSVQVLWLLEANPQGLRVLDVMAHFKESGELHRSRWAALMGLMKRAGRVRHVEGVRGAGRAGRFYVTPLGLEWASAHLAHVLAQRAAKAVPVVPAVPPEVLRARRSVLVLRFLLERPAGAVLDEVTDEGLGDASRACRRATVTMLRSMRIEGRVRYAPLGTGPNNGGRYWITAVGQGWLARFDAGEPLDVEEVVLPTGAMAGESRMVVHSVAQAGQVRVRGPVWVFGLGCVASAQEVAHG